MGFVSLVACSFFTCFPLWLVVLCDILTTSSVSHTPGFPVLEHQHFNSQQPSGSYRRGLMPAASANTAAASHQQTVTHR